MTTPTPPAKAADTQAWTAGVLRRNGTALWSESCKDRGNIAECRLRAGTHIADDQNEINAARIEACWNAMDGIDSPADLRKQRDELLSACKLAQAHVEELREAWQRGCINETDGQGGTRPNRNVDVDVALRAAIALATGEKS